MYIIETLNNEHKITSRYQHFNSEHCIYSVKIYDGSKKIMLLFGYVMQAHLN